MGDTSRLGEMSRGVMTFPLQSSSFCVSNNQNKRVDSNFSFIDNRLETKDSNKDN